MDCDCDRDQNLLCDDCDCRIDVEKWILSLSEPLSTEKSIARLALSCKFSTDIGFLAEQFSRIIDGLKRIWLEQEINKLEKIWLVEHPIVRYMTMMMRNRTYVAHSAYSRIQLQVETLAEVE